MEETQNYNNLSLENQIKLVTVTVHYIKLRKM
jgi:hypothetical protein